MAEKNVFLIDMRACQQWRDRGIPRYIQSLVLQFAKDCLDMPLVFLYDRKYPPPLRDYELRKVGEVIYSDKPILEDYRVTHYLLTWLFIPVQSTSVQEYLFPEFLLSHRFHLYGLVYDFIPLRFKEIYLPSEQHYQQYMDCISIMEKCDRVFVISEFTRQDGIQLAGLDSEKVVCINGSIDEEKWAKLRNLKNSQDASVALSSHLTQQGYKYPKGQYWIYVGGDDWRKNLEGAIQGFAYFKKNDPELAAGQALVITCSMEPYRKEHFYQIGKAQGLCPDKDLIITGYVSDHDLFCLITRAKCSIFPSLYEGLGLPILESYECATPVIGSASSSIQELVHPDCSFDPKSPQSIAEKMRDFAKSSELRLKSLQFGEEILRKFRWKETSRIVGENIIRTSPSLNEFNDATSHAHKTTVTKDKQILPVFSCLPPETSGIAIYTEKTLFTSAWDNHFFQDSISFCDLIEKDSRLETVRNKDSSRRSKVFHSDLFNILRSKYKYQAALFVLGNSWHHVSSLRNLLLLQNDNTIGKYIYLHEALLLGAWAAYLNFDINSIRDFLSFFYPDARKSIQSCQHLYEIGALGIFGVRPLVKLVQSKTLIVNSLTCKNLIEADLAPNMECSIETAFHPIFPAHSSTVQMDHGQKNSDSILTVGTFGILAPHTHKHPEILIEACRMIARSRPIRLVVAGFCVKQYLDQYGFKDNFIQAIEAPVEDELLNLMESVDIAVQLRWPTYGEVSGCIHQLLSLKKRVIVTAGVDFSEYGDSVILSPVNVSADKLAKLILESEKLNLEYSIEAICQKYSVRSFQNEIGEILGL